MFDSLFDLASDIVEIAATPVVIAAKVADAALQPVVEAAREIRKEFDEY